MKQTVVGQCHEAGQKEESSRIQLGPCCPVTLDRITIEAIGAQVVRQPAHTALFLQCTDGNKRQEIATATERIGGRASRSRNDSGDRAATRQACRCTVTKRPNQNGHGDARETQGQQNASH